MDGAAESSASLGMKLIIVQSGALREYFVPRLRLPDSILRRSAATLRCLALVQSSSAWYCFCTAGGC
eukprot:3939490-Amphidinium_carterae.2